MTDHFDLCVIGSGPAGEKGAAQAAYFGKKVCLVERAPRPGPGGGGPEGAHSGHQENGRPSPEWSAQLGARGAGGHRSYIIYYLVDFQGQGIIGAT